MVNCLQRCAAVAAQCSLREGFSLTVKNGIDGRLVSGDDPRQIAETLDQMLAAPKDREAWGRCARKRVHSDFLIFRQVLDWLRLLAGCEA